MPCHGIGSGILRALEAWPDIDFEDDREGSLFKPIVRRTRRSAEDAGAVAPEIAPELSALLERIIANPRITTAELADALKVSRRTVLARITTLKEKGILRRTGPSKGGTSGGYYSLPAKSGARDGPLLIAEGYATGASLHLAMGHAELVAFNAGNLEAVARMARRIYPKRELVLCADNDCETVKPDSTPWNPGKDAASRAAQAVGAKLAVCPAHEGRATDFNDLHRLRSLDAVRAGIVSARKEDGVCPMPGGFFLVPEGPRAGLYKQDTKPDGEMSEVRIGPPLAVKGMTRDSDGNEWGLMLEWADPDGKKHTWAMPIELLFRQGADWFSSLVSGGWLGNPLARKKLVEFFSSVRTTRRIRCEPLTGWDMSAYILPDTVYGANSGDQVVLQSAHHGNLYRTAGTLDGWREITALAVGNSRLSFALCVALAGPLLRLAGLEGGDFSFEGASSSGKTTILHWREAVGKRAA